MGPGTRRSFPCLRACRTRISSHRISSPVTQKCHAVLLAPVSNPGRSKPLKGRQQLTHMSLSGTPRGYSVLRANTQSEKDRGSTGAF